MVVSPDKKNLSVYGPQLRQLLLAACTEVEASWRGILRDNEYSKEHLNTKDYVKLCDPLQLDEYALGLWDYPATQWLRPFKGWDPAKATESLPWYHAYNLTKHDRERHLADTSLCRAISAVAATLALASAQFGMELFAQGGGRYSQSTFKINGPTFAPHRDGYVPLPTGGRWKTIPCPF
jgi:hypothetical protein